MDVGKAKCPNCGENMGVTSMVCADCDVRIDARFELSSLARLSPEDQLFVNAFVHGHGSIKQMEKLFGISYPTVKNRLTAISQQLDPITNLESPEEGGSVNTEVIDLLAKGEITVEEAIQRLER